jgi:S-adenosylmethionine synthetase
VARPLAIQVETFGTSRIPATQIEGLIREHFDLRPAAIIRRFDLRRPIYRPTAAYGHFGRPDLDLPWEQTDVAAALRQAAFGSATSGATAESKRSASPAP